MQIERAKCARSEWVSDYASCRFLMSAVIVSTCFRNSSNAPIMPTRISPWWILVFWNLENFSPGLTSPWNNRWNSSRETRCRDADDGLIWPACRFVETILPTLKADIDGASGVKRTQVHQMQTGWANNQLTKCGWMVKEWMGIWLVKCVLN